jgi:hypothetical protein
MLRGTGKRRGTITLLVAVLLIAIFGVVAIALDGGLLLDNHRHVQSAADAAALAAADDLFTNYNANDGSDPSGTAATSAKSTASANGFSNDGVTSTVTVNIPPTSGSFNGKKGYAEVIIQYNQKRNFSSIFGTGDLPVKARAVACGMPGNIGILILDPTLKGSCEIDGTVNILNNGQIYSNSNNTVNNDAPSANCTGSVYLASTATLSCGGINVYNSLVNNGSLTYTNNGGLTTLTQQVTDPLASITEPTTAGLTVQSDVNATMNQTLQPGVYTNITVGSTAGWTWSNGQWTYSNGSAPTVTLAPGIYYLANGSSFTLNAGSITGTGVMIFNNTGGDNVFGMSNPAGGVINLTPPTATSGGTWPTGTTSATNAGISMWLPRARTDEAHVESSYNLTMSGTWYGQNAEFDIRPDGSKTVFNVGNYICGKAEWGQGFSNSQNLSNGTINMNPGTSAATMRPKLVE